MGGPTYVSPSLEGEAEIQAAIVRAQNDLSNDSGCEPLVVVAGTGYGTLGVLGFALNDWLGQDATGFNPNTSGSFWAVFVPPPPGSGVNATGHGWSNFPTFDEDTATGRMAGQLVQDQNGRYVFRPSTLPAYGENQLTFRTSSNGITVEPAYEAPSQSYPAGTPGCPGEGRGGFQVLVLEALGEDALKEAPLPDNGDTFWVNGCSQSQSEAAAAAMSALLGTEPAANGNPPRIVFVQGVGNALPTQPSEYEALLLRGIAQQIGQYGGSPGAFLNNKAAQSGPGYSFVGQSWPLPGGRRVGTEVTSDIAGAAVPAQLDGFFTEDSRSRIAPTIGTSSAAELGNGLTGAQALTSASAIVHSARGFQREAFPGEGEADWEIAMHYLAKNLSPTVRYDPQDACFAPKTDFNGFVFDLRATYCGGGDATDCSGPYDSYYSQIAPGEPLATVPAGLDIPQSEWTQILSQLQSEFLKLQELNCMTQSLQQVFGSVSQKADLDVSGMVDEINAYIQDQKKKPSTGVAGSLAEIVASMSNVVAVGASLEEDWAGMNVFWGVQGMIDLGLAVADTPTAGGPVLGPLPPSTTATGFAMALENGLGEISSSMTSPRNQIASDWGRLQSFDQTAVPFQDSDVTAAETVLSYATYDRAWKSILPSVFMTTSIGTENNADPVDVPNWQCSHYIEPTRPEIEFPFDRFTPNTYTAWPTHRSGQALFGLEAYALAGMNFSDGVYSPIPAPDEQVLTPIFGPMASPNAQNPTPITNGVPTSLSINKDIFFADVITASNASGTTFDASQGAPDCPKP
jgi:hypothetical protein